MHLLQYLSARFADVNPAGATTTVAARAAASPSAGVDKLTKATNQLVASGQAIAGSLFLLVLMGLGFVLAMKRGQNALAIASGFAFVLLGIFIVLQPQWMLDVVKSVSDSMVK